MFRSRLFRAIALLAGMAAVMYLTVSLFLPSSRRLIFGVDKRNGYVRLVRSHVTFLPPHRYYRLVLRTGLQRSAGDGRGGLFGGLHEMGTWQPSPSWRYDQDR